MRIGLTGGIATGKSTVSNLLRERGIPVVDADIISRRVVMPGEKAYNEIVQVFGASILQDDGSLDRKKLGSIIFRDEIKRKQLNSIVHPAVRQRMTEDTEAYLKQGHPTVVLDIPLLIESQLMYMVDKVIVVYVPEEIQLQRLMERDNSTREEALSRIHAQMPIDEKIQYASATLYNDRTIKETEKQLDELLQQWRIKTK